MASHLSDQLRPYLGNAIGDGMNEVVVFASFEDWRFQQGLFKPLQQKDASYPSGISADSLKILPVAFLIAEASSEGKTAATVRFDFQVGMKNSAKAIEDRGMSAA
jgi:hypothetical protein